MTTRDVIEEVKQKLDIITIVQDYLPALKHSGRNFFAPCPFHNEKTPSFSVSQEIQRYKCFGCGESGDVITFVQNMENVEFPKALELCAKKAGIPLERLSSYSQKDSKLFEKKKAILNKMNKDQTNES